MNPAKILKEYEICIKSFLKMPKIYQMKDEFVLILGAGLMQKPSIEAAGELGYKTLVVDANKNAVCVPFADVFVQIDLKDREKIADLAMSYGDKLKAVFTAGTDFSASVSYVAQKCGLISHSFDAAMNASNKVLMRKCFREKGVPSPDFVEVSESEIETLSSDDSVLFPKVVKPVDNMGARGCRLVRNKSEFEPALRDAVAFSRTGKAIVEDYMKGMEFSIDALVHEGNVTITGFADRHIFFDPYFIEMGHTMPSSVSEAVKKNVVDVFVKGVKALGLTEGVAKGDVKYTEKGAMIGEIAGRLSGGYMSGWTYPYASGVNLTMEAMKIALGLGKTLPSEIECNAVSHERAFISIPGVVSVIYGEDKAVASPFVKNVFFRVKEGSRVDFPRNNVEKCGNVISRCADRSLSLKGAEMAVSEIVLRLEKNNESTQNYLMGVENKYEKGFPYSAYELSSDELIAFEKEVESLDSVIIGENESILIPESLASFAGERQDFNYRTILNTLDKVNKYAGARKSVPAIKFWKSLIRGGVQGALYAVDTWGTEC